MSIYFLAVDSRQRLEALKELDAADFQNTHLVKPRLDSHISSSARNCFSIDEECDASSMRDGLYYDGVANLGPRFIDVQRILQDRPSDIVSYSQSLRGSFMIAHHNRIDNSIDIVVDPLSMYPLFIYQQSGLFACSNNIFALVTCLQRCGIETSRSSRLFALEGTFGNAISDFTSYQSITLLPPASRVSISGQNVATIFPQRELSTYFVSDDSYTDLLDRAEVELRDNIRACLDGPFKYRIADLTGGMDSRLVLAVILAEASTDNFLFATGGSYPTPDVAVADVLREKYSLTSGVDLYERLYSLADDPVASLCAQLRATDACYTHTGEMLIGTSRRLDIAHIGGGVAETFRGGIMPAPALAGDTLLHLLKKVDRRTVLTDKEREQQRNQIASRFKFYRRGGVPESALGDALYLFERNRYHFGFIWRARNLKRTNFQPLYSPASILAAQKLSTDLRAAGKVGFDLMSRFSSSLVEIPFAEKRWNPVVYRDDPSMNHLSTVDSVTRDSPPPRASFRHKSLFAPLKTSRLAGGGRKSNSTIAFQDKLHEFMANVAAPSPFTRKGILNLARKNEKVLRPNERRQICQILAACLWLSGAVDS